MLAAILVGALAATFALAVLAAVGATQDVARADASGWRAAALRSRALDAAVHEIRWRPGVATWAVHGDDPEAAEVWAAEWTDSPPDPASGWSRRVVDVLAAHGGAQSSDRLVLELRAESWAAGVTCSGDAEFRAPFTVTGSGVYVGGCVRGREYVAFAAGAAAPAATGPPDHVRGPEYAVAGVHAAAGIFADGAEVHGDASASPYPEDGDPHTGDALPQAWLAGPSAEYLVDAATAAGDAGAAWSDGVLRLPDVALATADELTQGRCLVLPEGDEVVLEGASSPAAGRLLVVVPGDAVVGQPGSKVELDGGLVVGGRLVVRGDLVLRGSLHAGSIVTEADVSVSVESSWRDRLLPGSVRPVIVEHGT